MDCSNILSGCLLPVSVAPLISLYQFLIGLVIQLETQLLPSSAPTSAMAVFMLFFSPTNYFPLKSSKGSRCQSSRCLQNNCHNRHSRFSSWVFLYLPLRLKSGTEGKKLVIPKKILLLPTSTNKSKVTSNLKNNAEQELCFYIGWQYSKFPLKMLVLWTVDQYFNVKILLS